jgi:spore coat protein U-like protein
MKKVLIFMFMVFFVLSGAAYAQYTESVSQGMTVQAEILPYATVTTTDINFGVLSSGYNQATATISVWASTGTLYNVAIDAGENFDTVNRRMFNEAGVPEADYINYSLNTDEDGGPDAEWGDNDQAGTFPPAPSAGPFTATGTTTDDHIVHGWLNLGPSGTVGEYFDVVMVTVHY